MERSTRSRREPHSRNFPLLPVFALAAFSAASLLGGCSAGAGIAAGKNGGGIAGGTLLGANAASSGFLLFATGTVEVERNGTWEPAQIGTPVAPPQRVRTGASSVAELQLSGSAAVMLLENTIVALEIGTAGTAAVHLESGSVIARAEQSPAGARLRIRSANNIIAATNASLAVEQEQSTRVAVGSGTASVLVTGIDPAEIAAATENRTIRAKLMELAGSGTIVPTGRQVVVPSGAGETTRQILEDVQSEVAPGFRATGTTGGAGARSSAAAGGSATGSSAAGSGSATGSSAAAPTAGSGNASTGAGGAGATPGTAGSTSGSGSTGTRPNLDLISQLLVYVAQRSKAEVPESTPVAPDAQQNLDRGSTIRLVPTTSEQNGAQIAASGLAHLTIHTKPEDAEILLDGHDIGKTIYSGLFDKNQTVTFVVHRAGYQDRKVEVTFATDLNREITVSLDRAAPPVSLATLYAAIGSGNPDVLNRYLAGGGDPNAMDANGYSPLAIALGATKLNTDTMALPVHAGMVSTLLKAGADANVAIPIGGRDFTPLFLVVAAGLANNDVDNATVAALLGAGADPNVYVETGSLEVNALGMTIIVGIERHNPNLQLLHTLIENGARVDSVLVYEGRIMAPLVAAVVLGAENKFVSTDIVKTLLQNGAQVNTRVNVDGEIGTPLYFARKYGFTQIADLLRQFGAHA